MAEPQVRRRFGGVRANAALVAGLMVALALVVGGVALVALMRAQLTNGVETAVVARAQDLSALAVSGELPDRLASSSDSSAQIIDSEGRVLRSTGDIEGQEAIPVAVDAPSGSVATLGVPGLESGEGEHEDDEGPFLLGVTATEYLGETVTVVVAGSLRTVDETTTTLVPLLIAGIPVLVGVVIAATWLVTGRTLAPVNAMAAEADKISGTNLQRRVPLPAASDEIRQLGETLNRMLDRLDASASRQRRFVSDASHELKSPVSAILTMAEVAGAHPKSVDIELLSADIGAEARRLALLVDDLLILARGDEKALTLDLSTFDLAALIIEEAFRPSREGLSVVLELPESLTVTGDRRRLAQAVRNLVDNAHRHAHSQVTIAAARHDGSVEVTVSDDGAGVPASEKERIFERFVRLDDARARSAGGTGLGLAVVRQIVDAHHGTIDLVDSPRSTGASFRIRITQPMPGQPDVTGETRDR